MKKRIYVIASLCVALGILWTGMGSGDANKVYAADVVGNVDGDESGVIDSADVSALLTELVDGSAVDTANDTNVDAALDVRDLMRLQRYVTPADTAWLDKENVKTDSDGTEYYEITNFAELYGLSTVEECDKTIRLAKDIVLNVDGAFKTGTDGKVSGVYEAGLVRQWTPIANFEGTFDGQGYTISGVYVSETTRGAGFFKIAVAATIQDFRMTNSYISNSGWEVGSVAGQFGGTMKNVFSDATVVSNDTGAGGLVGAVTTTNGATIENCWFDGKLQTSGRRAGGIVGHNDGSKATITVKNCLVTGKLSSSNSGDTPQLGGLLGLISSSEGATVNVSGCLFAGEFSCTSGRTYYPVGEVLGQIGLTDKQNVYMNITDTYSVEMGEKLLNASADQSKYPVVTGIGKQFGVANTNITGAVTVKSADSFKGINADVNTDLDFATSPDSAVPTWIVQEGTYPILGCFADMATAELLYMNWYCDAEGTAEDPYVLDTVHDLYGFAAVANDDEVTFDDKYVQLGADITLNEGNVDDWGTKPPENVWTPIKNFKGTFDGQGHTISGVYVNGAHKQGFFAIVTDGTIKNMRMTNSYICSSSYGTGSIAGMFSGTIQDVYSNAVVVTKGNYIGGLVGVVQPVTDGSNSISSSWFDGTIQTSNLYAGGIAGSTDTSGSGTVLTMMNCLVSGNLKTTNVKYQNATLGGLLGGIKNSKDNVTISDSLFDGVLDPALTKADGSTYSYRFVGYMIGALENGTVDLSNTYSTATVSWTTKMQSWAGAPSAGTPVAGIGYNSVVAENITGATTIQARNYFAGDQAKTYTNLDFTTPYWVTVPNRTPVLNAFKDLVEESDLCVMTYNVRTNNQAADKDNTERHWEHRKDYVLSGIQANAPSILGLQELANASAYTEINKELTEQGYAFTNRTDSTITLPIAILYKSSQYTEVAEGYFTLLENPSSEQRYCVWVVLQDTATRNQFLVANTHYSNKEDDDSAERLKCSATIINTLPSIMEKYCVTSMILMGDFNCTSGSDACMNVVTAFNLLDCKYQTTNTVDCPTNNNWGNPVSTIDHILISKTGFDVKYYNVDNTMYGDNDSLYASDHYPVVVGLDF